jgi:hypothetical protein
MRAAAAAVLIGFGALLLRGAFDLLALLTP